MINPQKENGFTPIANELMNELVRVRLCGVEWQILLFVIRKTYGFNKKTDIIPISQFEKGCLLDRTQVCRKLKTLVAKQLLVKTEKGYSFNKHYNEWVVAKQLVAKQCVEVVAKQPPSITNTKERRSTKKKVLFPMTHTLLGDRDFVDDLNDVAVLEAYPKLGDSDLRSEVNSIMAWLEDKKKPHSVSTMRVLNWLKRSPLGQKKDDNFYRVELERLGFAAFANTYGLDLASKISQ